LSAKCAPWSDARSKAMYQIHPNVPTELNLGTGTDV
jgi:hypothetical protein